MNRALKIWIFYWMEIMPRLKRFGKIHSNTAPSCFVRRINDRDGSSCCKRWKCKGHIVVHGKEYVPKGKMPRFALWFLLTSPKFLKLCVCSVKLWIKLHEWKRIIETQVASGYSVNVRPFLIGVCVTVLGDDWLTSLENLFKSSTSGWSQAHGINW